MAETGSRWDPTTRQQLERLDRLENQARRRWSEWLSAVAAAALWWVTRPTSPEQIANATLPLPGQLARLLTQQGEVMLGTGMAHGDYEVRRLLQRYAGGPTPALLRVEANHRVVPVDALRSLHTRSIILAGDVEADVLTGLKRIGMRSLTGQIRPRQAEAAVEQLMQTTAARARNIVTTEGTRDYNAGRVATFKAGEVDHVQFSAILDQKTSHQCRTRHGLIMAMDDPRLKDNTPPLHGHCRSILKPVLARYEPDLMRESWRFDWSNAAALPMGWSPHAA